MIRVKSVQIKGFRGIREGAVRDFADVNLLVGRNNSGKSTVVEAIHRLASAVSNNSPDPIGRRSEVWSLVRGENGLVPSEIWYKLDQTQPISIAVDLGTPDSVDSERIALTLPGRNTNRPLLLLAELGFAAKMSCSF
jgi:predicted ATP-dependent endonuclease of OLD family